MFEGGGFALSDASRDSGLSAWLGEQLSGLRVLPPFVIMLIICIMTVIVTEVASNTATANILLPILAQMVLFDIKCVRTFHNLPVVAVCYNQYQSAVLDVARHSQLLVCFHVASCNGTQRHRLLSRQDETHPNGINGFIRFIITFIIQIGYR